MRRRFAKGGGLTGARPRVRIGKDTAMRTDGQKLNLGARGPGWLSRAAGLTILGLATTLPAGVPQRDHRQSGRVLAQTESSEGETHVPSDQLERYIAAYKLMQRNHRVTAEQAAAKQGLSLEQFRSIERSVESNDRLRSQVRRELKAAPKPTSSPSPSAK
jgi:hypothetical protein